MGLYSCFSVMLGSKCQRRSSLDWPGNGAAGVGDKVAMQAVVGELSQGIPHAQVSEAPPVHDLQQVFVMAWGHIDGPCAGRCCVQVDPVHPRLCRMPITHLSRVRSWVRSVGMLTRTANPLQRSTVGTLKTASTMVAE